MQLTPSLINDVLLIAQQAGQAILAIYAKPERWCVQTKGDDSPLTAADQAAHTVIAKGLLSLSKPWSALPLLSEESSAAELSQRLSWPACWMVDPLDGTKEFLARNDEFTVNIALIGNGHVVLGVILAPVTGVAYVAAKGLGSYRIDAQGRQPIRVASAQAPIKLLSSRRHGLQRLAAFEQAVAARWGEVSTQPKGSSLKLCAVAEGSAHASPRFGPTSEWDTAAAQIILEQAGGYLVDSQGRPFRYNQRQSLLNDDFVAVGQPLADWLACWGSLT